MAKIKTKDTVKGTIKTLDKAAIASERMKQAYISTKDKAEHSTQVAEGTAEEYASDRFENATDTVVHEAAYQFDKAGRKGFENTKENVVKAKDGVQKLKEKRAAKAMKRRTVNWNGQRSVKAVEQTQKTVKESAKSAGKKMIIRRRSPQWTTARNKS